MLLNGFQRTPQRNQGAINSHFNLAESSLTKKQVNKLISDILNHLPLALKGDRVVISQPTDELLKSFGLKHSSINQHVRNDSPRAVCKV